MQLFFLHHSAVAVKTDEALLIFDYYRFARGEGLAQGHISGEDIRSVKRVYVFASHAHGDHFSPRIFEWAKLGDDVTYILDAGIGKPKGVHAVMLRRGEEYGDGYIRVAAFGSTDIGSSFYVECEGVKLFHAGDLNFWHWRAEGDAEYTRQMALHFEREMDYLRSNVERIDVAFFPVDKRMEAGYDEGADMFIAQMKPGAFVPIHFVDFEDTSLFAMKHGQSKTKVYSIEKNGQQIIYTEERHV